jgi:hypothetical protein
LRKKKIDMQIAVGKVQITVPVDADLVTRFSHQLSEGEVDHTSLGRYIGQSLAAVLKPKYAPPTTKQIAYAKHIADVLNIELTDDVLATKANMAAFLAEYAHQIPPTRSF